MFIDDLCFFFCECLIYLRHFANFFKSCFVFILLSFRSSPHILSNKPLLDITFTNIFSHSVGCLLILLILSFDTKFLNFSIFSFVQIVHFFFCFLCVWWHIQKLLPNLTLWSFWAMFYSKSFIVLGLSFRSLIHLEFFFVYIVI